MGKFLLVLSMIFLGCFAPKENGPDLEKPAPDGNTFESDANGVLRPTFVVQSVAMDMQAVEVVVQTNEFRGVSFDMAAGSVPKITVVGELDVAYRAFIYGPQTEQGLWGRVLYEASGINTRMIEDWVAETDGQYLLLAVPNQRRTFEYSVAITCNDCGRSSCALETPCNTYCPQGRAIDSSSGCTTCECAGASCVTEGCSVDNEVCVFKCGEGSCAAGQTCNAGRCENQGCAVECGADEACFQGMCALARYECAAQTTLCEESCPPLRDPVCAEVDGRQRTVPNQCLAECLDSTNIVAGPCQPTGCQSSSECAAGEDCRSGMCVVDPACGCDPSVQAPVCGEKMGQRKTFRNECEMLCQGFTLEYPGSCVDVPRCESSLDCRGSERCIALPNVRVMGNEERCSESPAGQSCIRGCIPRQRCHMDQECGEESVCLSQGEEGLCMPRCNLEDAVCERGEKCVTSFFDPTDESTGICLTACDVDGACSGVGTCSAVEAVCLQCDHCEFNPEEPICVDQIRYDNGCEMLCGAPLSLSSTTPEITSVGPELCNGIDDNCNGEIDENLSQTCSTGVARCEQGRQTCSGGQWGPCELVPVDVIERCNDIDDDCDGEVDEAPVLLEAGQVDCTAPLDCRTCPQDWSPVCTDRGIAPNECFATCEGLQIKPIMECGLRAPPTTRCESDDDCMKSRCVRTGQAVCAGFELQQTCVQYTNIGGCFERSGRCGCNRELGTCGFDATVETFDCIEESRVVPREP